MGEFLHIIMNDEMIYSANHDALALFDLESAAVVVFPIDLYGDVPVFQFIICVFLLFLNALVLSFPLEVVPEGGVLQVGLDFELLVWKVEKEDAEKVVGETDDGGVKCKISNAGEGGDGRAILYGLQKEEEEAEGEEDADEDVEHENLIA